MFLNIKTIGLFLFFFISAFSIFYRTSENFSIQRDPAALNGKIFQITNLTTDQIKIELQKKIKMTPTIDGKKSISFAGFSSAICKSFSEIQFEFIASNMVVNGEAPSMKISAPCEEGQDPSEIASIKLPIEKILNEKVRNAEFNFEGYNVGITFTNSADEWPQQWILKRVEFKNINGNSKFAEFGRSPASLYNTSYEAADDQPIILEF